MSNRNDVTGDLIATKSSTQAYADGWERIFGKKPAVVEAPAAPAEPVKMPLKLMSWQLYLPDHLDEKVLAGRPESLDDRHNWWSWCETHQLSISNIPTFEQWRAAHSSAA